MASIKKNYFYNLFYQLLLIITPIITVPYLSRVLGPEGIGIQSYTNSIVQYFILFGTLGISLYGQREIATYRDDKFKRSVIFCELFIIKFFTVSISLILYLIFSVFFVIEYKIYFFIFSLEIFSCIFDVTWFYQGVEDFKYITIRNVIFRIIPIIFIFIFVKDKYDLPIYITITVICSLLGSISLLPKLRKDIQIVKFIDLNFTKHFKGILLIFLPQIAIQIYTVLDKTMIGVITNDVIQNGYYEQSTKIIKMVLTIITSMGTVIIPRIAFYNGKKNIDETQKILENVFSFVCFLAFPMCFGLIAIANNFVPIFFGNDFLNSVSILQVLSLLFLAIGFNNVIGMQYLIPTHKENIFTLTVCAGAVTNIICNLILIPKYGALGAAIGSVIAESVITLLQIIITWKKFNYVKIIFNNWKFIFSSLIMFIVLKIILNNNLCNLFKLICIILLSIIIYLGCLILLKEKTIISVIKKIFWEKYSYSINVIHFRRYKNDNGIKRKLHLLKIFFTTRFFNCESINDMLKKVSIKNNSSKFFYYIDKNVFPFVKKTIAGNFTPKYELILENSLNELENIFFDKDNKVFSNYIKKLNKNNIYNLNSLLTNKPLNFFDALQGILFVNQLFWQAGHTLIGLGNLENILYPFYKADKEKYNYEEFYFKDLIKEFILVLHRDYEFKSSLFNGDTGQAIVVTGKTELGKIFIDAVAELEIPEPKIILKCSEETKENVYVASINSIEKGIGCPIFCNDKIIIKAMEDFGYDSDDAKNYGFSACWEPLIPGKSIDCNNFTTLNFLEPLTKIDYNNLDYENVLKKYFELLKTDINKIIFDAENFEYEYSSVLSIFNECKYNFFGITSCGFINLIHSLYNIKNNTINKKEIDFLDNDFIEIANLILKETSNMLYSKKVGKIKLGTSSPSYINFSKNCLRTPDGRKDFDLFKIHISKDDNKDYSSIFMFARQLNYFENRFNGNIVDLVVDKNTLKKNKNNFIEIIKTAINIGVFQIQFSVLDSKILIDAKKNPNKYPKLIVRVWGFSAYFVDLPIEYQDFLIERALSHENKCK